MERIYQRCCGIEVLKNSLNACVRLGKEYEVASQELRNFRTDHNDLGALREWLRSLEVTHVAIQAKGEAWRPLHDLLEDGFDITLVDAGLIKQMYARPSDGPYCEYLAILLEHGLLPPSFAPPTDMDTDKIDEAVLALMSLTLHEGTRAWKGFDWDSMNRLHKKGFITNPVSKAKSVEITEEGLRYAQRSFKKLFTRHSMR